MNQAQPVSTQATSSIEHDSLNLQPRIRITWLDLGLVFTMTLWGTNYAVAKAALDILPPFVFNAMRFWTGAAAVWVVLLVTRTPIRLPRSQWRSIIGAAIINYPIYQFFFMYGLKYTNVAHSVLILTVSPIGVVLYNILRKRERGSRRIYTGILMALGGVALVIITRYGGTIAFGGNTLLGDGLTLIAAVAWVAATLAVRFTFVNNPPMVANFWSLVWGALFMTVLGIPDLARLDWSRVQAPVVISVLYSGAISIAIGGTLWAFALKKLGSSHASIYLNLQPIVAAAVAILFLGEAFTPWLVAGTALVLIGMWRIRQG